MHKPGRKMPRKCSNVDTEDFGRRIESFGTYEEFLQSKNTEKDFYYLEDIQMAMSLVELGALGGPCDGCAPDLFGKVKEAQWEKKRNAVGLGIQTVLMSPGKVYDDVMLKALQHREEANRMGKMSSIFYIRCLNQRGQEVSGYVDYAERLNTENFEPIFDGRKKFRPKTSDLSFVNLSTMHVSSTDSENYEVISNSPSGMLFRNRRDHKVINLDPAQSPGESTWRTVKTEKSDHYISIVIYDHMVRKKC